MNPGIIDFFVFLFVLILIFGSQLLFFLFLDVHHLLYFFIFEVLDDSEPVLGKFIILE